MTIPVNCFTRVNTIATFPAGCDYTRLAYGKFDDSWRFFVQNGENAHTTGGVYKTKQSLLEDARAFAINSWDCTNDQIDPSIPADPNSPIEVLHSCAKTLVWVAPTCTPVYRVGDVTNGDPARYGTIAELMEAQLSQLPRGTKVSVMGFQSEVDGGQGFPHCELHGVTVDEAVRYLNKEKQEAADDFDATLFPILASDLALFS